MKRDRAAYMRAYRAKGKPESTPAEDPRTLNAVRITNCGDLVEALQDEVARLKRELAARPNEGFGRSMTQVERDAILRKISHPTTAPTYRLRPGKGSDARKQSA